MTKIHRERMEKVFSLVLLILAILSLNIFIGNRQSAYAGIQLRPSDETGITGRVTRYELANNPANLEALPRIEPSLHRDEQPLASQNPPQNLPARPTVEVVVDAGHGGGDGGTVGHGEIEKNWTLPLAVSLARELRQRGVRVAMTRESDIALSLEERTKFANAHGSPLFVSLHLNNCATPEVHGIETFYSWPKTMGTQAKIRRLQGLKPGSPLDDPGNEALAMEVQRRICEVTGAKNRGIKNTKFYVNRFTTGPSILVECGFLSNSSECRKITTSAYRKKLVTGIADAVCYSLDAERVPKKDLHIIQ